MGHALHSALGEGQIKGILESGEHPLLLFGYLSHICLHLSYFSDLFLTLVWDFNALFNFSLLLLLFVLYSAKKRD